MHKKEGSVDHPCSGSTRRSGIEWTDPTAWTGLGWGGGAVESEGQAAGGRGLWRGGGEGDQEVPD